MSQVKSILPFFFFVNALAKEHPSGLPIMDKIFDSLSRQQWNDDMLCRDKIFHILENVNNSTLWATWVWNSIDQSPTGIFFGARYHLGNYDQCLRPPWLATHPELRTQYCLAEVEMNNDGVKIMDQVPDPYGRAEDYYVNFLIPGLWGLPSRRVFEQVCGEVREGADKQTGAAWDATVSIHHCEQAGIPHTYSNGFYVFIYTCVGLLFLAVASTYYVTQYPANTHSFVNRVAKSFCIRRNWNTIVRESDGDLPCLDGIRVLSAACIPLWHTILLVSMTSVSNGLDVELTSMQHPTAYFLVHMDVLTDCFLVISGLLLGTSLDAMDITTPYKLLTKILSRYLRLIGPLAVAVFYMAHVSMHTDDGPVVPKTALLEQQTCEKNWWLTLLMLGNYVNTLEMCIPGSWQVACDFQLYVVTLVLVFVYRKSPRVGKAAAAALLVCGAAAPAITTYIHNLPGVVLYNIGLDFNDRSNKFFHYLYIRTHNRIGPYAAGLAAGYLMSKYKPKDYKKIYSKKLPCFLGVSGCLSLMMLVLGAGLWTYRHKVLGVVTCVFATFERTTFSIAVLGVIAFCTYGDVPLVNSFLGWRAFAPLSRLSYGLYLIHQLVLYRRVVSLRSQMKVQFFDILTDSLGVTVVSLALSLAVWMLVEAPLSNFRASWSRRSRNGVHHD